jgi:ATP-dependent exoDNAse (exonuclease V) alpha subunit
LAAILQGLEDRFESFTIAKFILQTEGLLPDGRAAGGIRENYGSAYSVVVDEVGFLDSRSFKLLLDGARDTRHVILVGDPNQLCSIGSGAVLRDLKMSKRIPHVHLGKVHRASDKSGIPQFAAGLLEGRCRASGPGVRSVDAPNTKRIVECAVMEYVTLRQVCPIIDMQIVASTNKICAEINAKLRERCNKRGRQVHECLRVGDPVIITANDHQELVKGDVGWLRAETAQGDLLLERYLRDSPPKPSGPGKRGKRSSCA